MNGDTGLDTDNSEFIEVDPTGRYGRYNEILGKGSSKTVYRAFDEYEGIEVAWNQVKLYDFLQSPEDLERLYCEIHLLKTLNHNNIMKFYTSWVDTANRNINFVTEMFTSGTLRQYRLKHRRVNIRAVKHWCRQILKGLLYLHSRDPPVIHRDLKCDNIFVNGNQGEVKIGDLGLAAILRKSHAARCVGTPEFMAPEVYEEEYNELVDIYSFGMCVLEMVTFEYPYSECTHPAQIYKKVISGKKPEALNKVKDPEVRRFVEKCLATVSLRLSARELLNDPFLRTDDYGDDVRPIEYLRDFDGTGPFIRQQYLYNDHYSNCSLVNDYSNYFGFEPENGLNYELPEFDKGEISLFTCHEDEHLDNAAISIKGRKREDDGVFLRIRISDKEGRNRNIYFPFDIEADTALSVATEMIAELDMTDQDVNKIADIIDGEIATLVPDWKRGLNFDESPHYTAGICQNCALNGSLMNYICSHNLGSKSLQVLQCSRNGCAAVHGRFEEITYQVEGSEQCVTEGAPVVSSQSDIWAQHDAPEVSSQGSGETQSDEEELEQPDLPSFGKDERLTNMGNKKEANARNSVSSVTTDDYENEIRQELRWLKAKYQMQLRELRDQQLGVVSKSSSSSPTSDNIEQKRDNGISMSSISSPPKKDDKELLKSSSSGKHFAYCSPINMEKRCANLASQCGQDYKVVHGSYSPEEIFTAKTFYTGALLPHSLHRATSLPVDAVDF